MKAKPLLNSCYFKYCNFQGHNLKCHFESKAHLMPSETAKLNQSYLTHQVNSLTKVSKLKQNPPALCFKCHLFFDRTNLHLYIHHQIKWNSKQLENLLIKWRTLTKSFIYKFGRKNQIDNAYSKNLIGKNK